MKRTTRMVLMISVLAGAVAGGVVGSAVPLIWLATHHNGLAISVSNDPTIDVVKRVSPSVVSILITQTASSSANAVSDPFSDVPTPPPGAEVGGGSGFFVSGDGLIVTNRHVIADKDAAYSVRLQDGKTLPAKVVALDPVLDLGIIQVQGSGFPALELGDSDKLQPGQSVIAIGYALAEFENSVTKGVVSGLNRHLVAGDLDQEETIDEAIQTDAAINPGNSGGPLLDLDGKVVGINTAVTDGANSLGFALPSNAVHQAVDSVRQNGRIVRSWLGVRYAMIDEEYARLYDLKEPYGAEVIHGSTKADMAVVPGSPAAKAGLKENDIILDLNGEEINVDHSLGVRLSRHAPGETITLRIRRGDLVFDQPVTLDERKDQ